MRHLSPKELRGVVTLCAGVAFLLCVAVLLSGSVPFLPSSLKLAVSTINQTAVTANAAAVPYWQTATGNPYGGYPSPTSCYLNFQNGGNSAQCGFSFPAGMLSALVPGTSNGQYTYGTYQLGFYAPCYPSTGRYYSRGFTGSNTSAPLTVARSTQVQLDWACQPSQSISIYMACGDGWQFPSAGIYSSSYVKDSLGNTYPAGGNPRIGSASVTAPSSPGATVNYNLYCNGILNATVPVATTQAPTPTASISTSPTNIYAGQASIISWSSSNASSCSVSGPGVSSGATSGSVSTGALSAGTKTYSISCSGAGGSASNSATVNVGAIPANCSSGTCSISISSDRGAGSNTSVLLGKPVTLSWSCSPSIYSSSNGDANYSTGGALSGNKTVTPTQSTTYSLTCIAPSGTTAGSANLTVLAPIITFSTSPLRVRKNVPTPVTFTWKVVNAPAACTITGPSGFTPITVTPVEAVTNSQTSTLTLSQQSIFTFTCTGIGVQQTIKLIPAMQEL